MKIKLHVNGKKQSVDVAPMKRLLDTLREELALTGTKEGCGEGECGACTVLVDGAAVNACLVPTCQADGCDVQTVEGITRGGGKEAARLHRLQRAFLDHGAAQCGICTPGMLMAALALPKGASLDEIRAGLAGNLCRCTGYMKIYDAVAQFLGGRAQLIAADGIEVLRPRHLKDALMMLRVAADEGRPLVPMAGGTDLFVTLNAGQKPAARYLDLWRLDKLRGVESSGKRGLTFGGLATYTDCIESRAVGKRLPILVEASRQVGGVQIQNRGTLAGNIENGSPAADGVPVLMAADATVVLRSLEDERRVPLAEYYTGYRKTVRRPDELIVRIDVDVPEGAQRFDKVGTRAAQAISKVVMAAIGHRIAFGSVAPIIVRAHKLEAYVAGGGRDVAEAQRLVAEDVTPIDDVRSTAEYRRRVVANLVASWLPSLGAAPKPAQGLDKEPASR